MFAERSTWSRTSSAQVASMFCERIWREATTHVTLRSGRATALATCRLTRPAPIITMCLAPSAAARMRRASSTVRK